MRGGRVERQAFGQRDVGIRDVGGVYFVRLFFLRDVHIGDRAVGLSYCDVSGVTVTVGSKGTLSQPSTPTGGVVGALQVFDGGTIVSSSR